MKHYQVLLFWISFLAIVQGCMDITGKTYNEDTLDADMALVSNTTDSSEAAILLATIIRYKLNQIPLKAKTYGELIEEGKRYRDARHVEPRATATAGIGSLLDNYSFADNAGIQVNDVVFVNPSGYQVICQVSIENQSGHEITKLSGSIQLKDEQGGEVLLIPLVVEQIIPADCGIVVHVPLSRTNEVTVAKAGNHHPGWSWVGDSVIFATTYGTRERMEKQ